MRGILDKNSPLMIPTKAFKALKYQISFERYQDISLIAFSVRSVTELMKKKIVSYTILSVALLAIIVGVSQSGFDDTLRRATVICLECIGIG